VIKYEEAPDIKKKIDSLVLASEMKHLNAERIFCIRSYGSKSRGVVARCHALPKIMQKALNIEPAYIIEIISETFDKQIEDEKIKILIHELCLPTEEQVVIESEKGLEIAKIGKFIEKEFNKAKVIKKSSNWEWIIPSKRYKAISYNLNKKIVELNEITKLMRRRNTEKKIVEIITKDGRKIESSPTHPILFTKNPDSYDSPKRKTVHIKSVKAKDILKQRGIPRLLEIFSLPKLSKKIYKINLTDLLKYKTGFDSIILKKGYLFKKGVKGIKIPNKFVLDNELGLFFGFYLSKGSIDHKSGAVSFSFDKKEYQYHNLIKKILKERFGAKIKERKIHKGSCKVIYTYSRLLQKIISDVFGFGEKAHHKKIPPFVYYAPIEFISGLVDGWFAGDGHVLFNKKIRAVTLSAFSRSKELIFGMLLLLARLKIIWRLRRDQQDIRIQSFFIPKFFKYCKKLIEYKNMQDKIDSIKRMKHEKQFNFLKYPKIRNVKIKKYNDEYFYNLEVQPNNNFMHASGIFTHNCHIPKSFGGGFRHHNTITKTRVKKLFNRYKNSIDENRKI